VTRAQKWGLGIALFYAVFYMGGSYSFNYTHECVRSHQQEEVRRTADGDYYETTVTVCDWYTANAKRWTFLDPVRAIQREWLTSWVDAAILGGIAAAIAGYVVRQRRAQRREDAILASVTYSDPDY
jgi:hypothetical protein